MATVFEKLRAICSETLAIPEGNISLTSKVRDLIADSLDFLELNFRIAYEFNSEKTLSPDMTVGEIVAQLSE